MEAVYFGTYALFFGLALLFLVLSFAKINVLASIVFPVTSGVIWVVLAFLSFAIYIDSTTVWNTWAMAPICGVFAFVSFAVGTLNVFEIVSKASEIVLEDG